MNKRKISILLLMATLFAVLLGCTDDWKGNVPVNPPAQETESETNGEQPAPTPKPELQSETITMIASV